MENQVSNNNNSTMQVVSPQERASESHHTLPLLSLPGHESEAQKLKIITYKSAPKSI